MEMGNRWSCRSFSFYRNYIWKSSCCLLPINNFMSEKSYFIKDGKRVERQVAEIYSRVVGWLTPVKNYNPGKKSEYNDRKTFKIKK